MRRLALVGLKRSDRKHDRCEYFLGVAFSSFVLNTDRQIYGCRFMMTGAGVTSPCSLPATTFGFTPRTVGCAHVASSPFEVWRRDGWLDRARGLCARERNGRALQSPARSLLGPDAQQLIPGCFPFPAGGALPSLHLSVLHTAYIHSYQAALALLHCSPHAH